MKDKQSKKVVIINDIQSDAIEKAILILRSSGSSVSGNSAGRHLIAEAQKVINGYVQTVEGVQSGFCASRKSRRRGKRTVHLRRFFYVLAAFLGFLTAAYALFHFLVPFMEKI